MSQEMIVVEACALLGRSSAENLTMARLAESLNSGVMSLYRYFPNREALLDAIADHLVGLFETPNTEGLSWQAAVLKWLHATQRLWDDHPVALRALFWRQRRSTAWVKAWWLPVARLLSNEGLSRSQLAFAMSWLNKAAVGMIVTDAEVPPSSAAEGELTNLSPGERKFVVPVMSEIEALDRMAVREFAFRNIIVGLETLLLEAKAPNGNVSRTARAVTRT